MRDALTYRGEALPGVADLTDSEIADRIRHVAEIDRSVCRLLKCYRKRHAGNASACAAVTAVQAWNDLGLASIALAEHRQEVAVFTKRRSV